MNYIKKHYMMILYAILLAVAIYFKVPFLWILAGTVGFILLNYLIKLPSTAAWLGYYMQGTVHNNEKAYKLYEFSYRHHGKTSAPMIAYGMMLLQKGRYALALQVFQDVLVIPNLNPAFLKIVRQDLGYAYWKNGDLETAISTMELMLKDYDFLNNDFYGALGYFYIEAGDYQKAEEINYEALRKEEDNGPAYDNLALIRYMQGEKEEAKELFTKAMELRDSMASPKYYLGCIAEEEGDSETAEMYFRMALKSNVNGLTTISREMIEEKLEKYQ